MAYFFVKKCEVYFLLFFALSINFGKVQPWKKGESSSKVSYGNSSHPNIIILLADDLGYGDLSFSGHPTSRTPNIDKLASNSKFLTHFYVTSPVCSPSRASLLTGRYQMRSGSYPGTFIPNSFLGLPKNETTIAKVLKEKGYKTQIVGKWHLGVGFQREFLPSNPAFGFDNFLGLPYSHDMCPCPVCFPNNGSCREGCWDGYVSCALFANKEIIEQPVYLPDLTSRLLTRALGFLIEAKNENAPFFLYFPFHHIHHPQFSSSKFLDKNDRGVTGNALLELDWAVGTIVQVLKKLKLLDETLIWFTSDNGPSLQRHQRGGCAGLLRCGKGTTWEGGVRVPTFVHWPQKIISGRSNALTSALDILPTVASLVGVNTTHLTLDGVDISEVLFGDRNTKGPREFFAVYPETPTQNIGPFAVIYNEFKAHFYTQGSDLSDVDNYDPLCPAKHKFTSHDPPLLFDLYTDPGERYDLGKMDEYKDIIAVMSKWRENHMNNMTWMVPRTQKLNKRAEPCCTTPYCTPFPQCCDCRNWLERSKYWK